MAFKFTATLKGSKQLIAQLKRKEGEVFRRCKGVQNKIAKEIIIESNTKVPKDNYDLVRSARIQEDKSSKKRELRTLAVTYDTDYAVPVHEDLEAKHAPGTTAKFLEGPAKKRRRQYANDMKAAMEGGVR